MLYELVCAVRPNRGVNEIKEIARTTGSLVLNSGGVVRGVSNWGTFLLPQTARKAGGVKYNEGHYFVMRFDSSAKTEHAIRRTLGFDPRMIRYSIVKMGGNGNKLEDICHVAGKAQWPGHGVS